MTTTLGAFTQISNNMAKWQTITKADPTVKLQTAYFQANIGNVKTIDDLIKNPRLFNYAMTAFGMSDQTQNKALMKKVLEQGAANPKALANTLNNPNILAFAKAFDFAKNGTETTSSSSLQTTVVNNFIEQKLETNQGAQSPGVQLALYFQNKASGITSVYSIMADKKLLNVVQTALGISPMTGVMPIDQQASLLSKSLNVADFQDSKKLQSFIQKFCAMYDMNNNSASSTTSGALAIFNTNSSQPAIGISLLQSIQSLKLGGF